MKRATSVEEYVATGRHWKESLELLRELLKSSILEGIGPSDKYRK